MTSKVLLIVNGPSYVIKGESKDKDGNIIAKGEARGGDHNQGCVELPLYLDGTVTVTEIYSPKENN